MDELDIQLLAMTADSAGADLPSMLDRWNALHSGRTLLRAAAISSLLWASLRF